MSDKYYIYSNVGALIFALAWALPVWHVYGTTNDSIVGGGVFIDMNGMATAAELMSAASFSFLGG